MYFMDTGGVLRANRFLQNRINPNVSPPKGSPLCYFSSFDRVLK